MRARPNPVEALVTLPRLTDPSEQRASWRQAIAALGQSVRVTGPPPLDGVEQPQLVLAAQVALKTGLVDDLDWIAPGSGAVALYEITAALPPGSERRDFGRRVFARLYQGNAATCAAVASRMALGSGRSLEAAAMHARVSLIFDMPIGSSVNADSLALTLVCRREQFERWVGRPALGPLPARRLAAKLFEHAAREAVMRALQGDYQPREILLGEAVRPTLGRLLADREPLVWRHVAVARGLLSTVTPALREEVELALDPALSPTEWRRAAVSLVACLVGDAETALKQCARLLDSDVGRRDPGIAATMIWGLPRVIEAEPDAAEELLDRLARTRRPDVAEATAELLAEISVTGFGERAAEVLRDALRSRVDDDSPLRGIAARALRALSGTADGDSLEVRVRRALAAFESKGARAAYEAALEAMGMTERALDGLLGRDPLDRQSMSDVLAVLSDIDAGALERSRLADLLLLNRRPGDTDASVPDLERVYDRLGRWILRAEERAAESAWSRGASLANQRRLRVLLHLVDVESAQLESDALGVRGRVRRAVDILLRRLSAGPDAMVHRILCATLARSFDAAIREGVAEPSDLLLLLAQMIEDRPSIEAIAEASTNPEVENAIAAYARFLGPTSSDAAAEAQFDGPSRGATGGEPVEELGRRVVELSHGIGAGSYRGEALRQVLLRLGRALEMIGAARGLSELVDRTGSDNDPLAELESATDALRRLGRGAARRVLEEGSMTGEIAISSEGAALSSLLERGVSSGVPANGDQLKMAIGEITAELPTPIAKLIERVLERLGQLPVSATSDAFVIPLEKRRAVLPDWLLPRRTIGAFYVVRALGSGGGSSVFVARRVEERNDANAELYALKVPQYDPTIARSISEQQFLQLFREEAGALLSLPQHTNLARFVTFDLAAKPKPILVMELIRGLSLDRLIRSQALKTERAFAYIDGVLGGLQAMHEVGVGHLDLKPSNVILRGSDTPVLVDFGLSGRHLRPGCGTIEYCAPEVIGVVPEGHQPSPLATDIYAFACMAYELLTAQLLFDAEDETTLLSQQVSHDGWPPRLTELARSATLRDVCIVLAACLRRDPRARPSVGELRTALARLSPKLSSLAWPLTAPPPKAAKTSSA